jgi:DNA-3-methyladenine glycosylase
MFEEPGFAYIYLIYGMYYCFNIVTESPGKAAAVLLRSAEPVEGLEIMKGLSPNSSPDQLLSGPGKFCRSFGLSLAQNGTDLTGSSLFVEDHGDRVEVIRQGTRVGISKGADRKWRFVDGNSSSVSKPFI